MILKVKSVDVTQAVSVVNWSGSYKQAARKLEFTVVSSPTDNFFKSPEIGIGNHVEFFDQGKRLFSGYVFTKDKSSQSSEMSVTAYDGAIYLLKNNGAYNFKSMTAEQIARKICSDFDIPVGEFASTGIHQTKTFIGDSLHDIILSAYSKAASQNGKKYILIMVNNLLSVIERGSLAVDYTLTNHKDLTNSRYSESIEDMINKVKIVNEIGDTSTKTIDWGG